MVELTTLDTPKGKLELHVCKDGDGVNEDWTGIYEASFPPDQREDIAVLKDSLKSGSMELDETRDQYDEILCMTLTEVFKAQQSQPPFLLACYTAVVPDFRGMGIGSVHRRKLERLLKDEYEGFLGLFTEIESTKEDGLSHEDMDIRVRRKRFFLKLGLVPIEIDYQFPSMAKSEPPIAGELLWLPFADPAQLTPAAVKTILLRVYTEGYGLPAEDDFVRSRLQALASVMPVHG